MEVTGRIEALGVDEKVSDAFVKREVVVQTDEQYPQSISIQFVQDKVDLLDKYKVGDQVEVSVNLRGRKWTNPEGVDKYFNTIQGWRIKKLSEGGEPSTPATPATPATPSAPAVKKLVLIGKGLDHPYETWRASKWTDELLVSKGYAKWLTEGTPPAPASGNDDPDLPF